MNRISTNFNKKIHWSKRVNNLILLAMVTLGMMLSNEDIKAQTANHCFGTQIFTASQGQISDGSGPNISYEFNLDCKFLIKPSNAISVTLYPKVFDTELNYDRLRVYDGETINAPLIGEYSGNTIPSAINATQGSVLLHFISDNAISYDGFAIDYTSTPGPYCIGTKSIKAATGTINDGSDNGANYDAYSNCKWLIEPANASSIDLIFTQMDVESGNDFVKVYDGDNVSAPMIAMLSGNSIIGNTISSTGGKMLVQFTSNASVNMDGWEADYTAKFTNNNGNNNAVPYCSGLTTLTNSNGSFDDGSGSTDYALNSNCKWLIQPVGAQHISLNFTEFDLEHSYDFVNIYKGSSTSDPLIASYTGNTIPSQINENTSALLVHFISDNLNNASGWKANYTAQNTPNNGGNTGNSNSGGSSPNFCSGQTVFSSANAVFDDGSGNNTNYQNNANCEWLIQPAGASQVTLEFNYIQLKGNDFVYIHDGNSFNSPVIASFNGYNTSSLPLPVVSGGEMLVRFVTNGSHTDYGFEAEYTSNSSSNNSGNANGAYCNAITTLTAANGVFEDGSGTDDYMPNTDCKWLIQPNNASSITLDFSWLELENDYDYIRVYDGNSTNDPLLAVYTGVMTSTLPLISTGGSMLIHFESDNIENWDGFAANWTSTQNNSGNNGGGANTPCSGLVNLSSSNGSFSDGSGANNYEPNADCKWLIQVSGATSIDLDFSSFDLEQSYDYVKVYDGTDANANLLASLTGNTIPATISSSGSSLFVHFTSDNLINKGGWEANYNANVNNGGGNGQYCSGQMTLTSPQGSIVDGSASSNYAPNSDCKWLISPANIYSITLSVNQIDLENSYDYIKVYDGNTTNAPLLASWSGNTIPSNVTSTGGEMLVHFTSDHLINKSGFDLSYSTTSTPNNGIVNHGYCNDITSYNLPVGTFHDGSGVGADYLDSTHCYWLIQPNQADTIELTFISYDTEANYDFIRVYDGTTVSAPLIDVISGFGIYKKIIGTSGALLVEFTSDESYQAPGFLATWTTKSVQNGGAKAAPIADFIASAQNINVGDKIDFYDLSQNTPSTHSWIFVNGSNPISSVKNPTNIQYNTPGCYDVSLTVTNNFGADQTTKTCYINVNALVGLGEGEEYLEKDIKVFPNPTKGRFTIYFNPEKDKDSKLQITNLLGEIIYEQVISDMEVFEKEFDLSKHSQGIYFVNVSSGDQIISKKLTIN